MVYKPNQVSGIFPYIRFHPAWFICGGPGNGNEIQHLVGRFSRCRWLGVEPCEAMVSYQTEYGLPPNGTLLHAGLGSENGLGKIKIVQDYPNRSSMVRDVLGDETTVPILTLDSINESHGPFRQAVLWLDIEGMEYEALQGARQCFTARRFLVVNLEMNPKERPKETRAIESLMKQYGFVRAKDWNHSDQHFDRIYVLARRRGHHAHRLSGSAQQRR